jgi:1-acyl-sn-glycerol-3-phosphate acyltransferase
MKPARTPGWRRLARLARLCTHLARGLLIAWLRYPRLTHAAREAEKRRWSKQLLSILSLSVRETNAVPRLPQRCMLVLNHISWLDIFVIDANFPATFIAKSEIRGWPLLGWLCTLVGTLYIERGKRAAAQARVTIAQELARGTLIAVCPEGTTTFGASLERFHAALFQPAIDAGATVQPLALRYVDNSGRRTDAAGYVGETSFLSSLWTIVSTPHMVAEMTFPRRIEAAGETRRTLAEKTEKAIAGALGIPPPRGPRTALE